MDFGKNNFLINTVLFILRQLYRIFFILPFQAIVFIISLFDAEPSDSADATAPYCFVITSIIYPKLDKLIQYNAPRSVFSPEDRAKQTLQTIDSIYSRVPGAKIILVEGGLQSVLPLDLHKKVDQYIYVGDKKIVRLACDSKQKSLGEIMMLWCSLKSFKFISEFYFKMSGRYFLNDEFNLAHWQEGQFVLQYIKEDYVCTRLYGFKRASFLVWKYALLKGAPLALIAYPIENTLAKYIPKDKVHRLQRLGVSGVGASSSDIIKD